jgi:hypothetical protein
MTLITAPNREDISEETVVFHSTQDDVCHCAIINISAFILEKPNERNFKREGENTKKILMKVFQELQDQTNQQLASFIVHKVT